MAERRHAQVAEVIAHMAGDFFARESTASVLLTVTYADLSPDFKNATVYLSVLPEKEEDATLKMAKRLRSDFRVYMQKHSFLHPTPVIDFAIDHGEKNRQRIDDLTRKKNA